ncbi:MAG: signal peptide peptidase SppA [Planctomycetales bacterium]|nr:signal peptide peptidase SppA [Planctomycetales bacterium]
MPDAPAPAHVTPTQQIVLQQPSAFGRYGRYLLLALALAVGVIVTQAASYRSYFSPPNAPQEKYHSLSETATKKIAVIHVTGTIVDSDGYVKQQIDRIREDGDVAAIVLRVDSPGGTVTSSDYLYHHLRKLREDRSLPLVVSMGGICASGGYYLAMACGDQPDAVFAEPSTWTGSIGVVIPHYDLSGLLADWQVKDDSIASHRFKLMGSPTRELDAEDRAEERALLQELVDRSFDRFKEVVRNGRPKLAEDEAALARVATGQIFTSGQALEYGLVDRIGFIEDAVHRAVELAGLSEKTARCVKYDPPPVTLGSLLNAEGVSTQRRVGPMSLSQLLDLTAPRAYYLCTWLPHLLGEAVR